MSGWETTINSGNPEYDRMTVEQYRAQVAAQGMTLQVQPLPTGGFHVRAVPAQQQWNAAPQQQAWNAAPQAAYAGPASSGSPAGYAGPAGMGAAGPAAAGAQPGALTNERVAYLRKVYGLLSAAVACAILSGVAILELGPTEKFKYAGKSIVVPSIVMLMAQSPAIMWGSFGLLFFGTIAAGWVSKVPVVNVIALFAVSILMGVQMAPFIMAAQIFAHVGDTLSTAPVRDAFLLVGAVFGGVTAYVFTTKKDFSYLRAILSMGFLVVFVAAILAAFVGSEIFTLAVCSVGALLAAGFLLWQTSSVLHGDMDDPVGDALVFLVQLRNLFMFLLRILMSSRN